MSRPDFNDVAKIENSMPPIESSQQVPREERQAHPNAEQVRINQPLPSFWARCHDRWALVAFLLSLAVYTILSGYAIYCLVNDYDDELDTTNHFSVSGITTGTSNDNDNLENTFTVKTGWMFAGASAIAMGLSLGLLFFVRYFPTIVIYMAPILCVTYLLGTAAGSFWLGIPVMGIISALFAAVVVLALFQFRSRIELAKDLMITANMAAAKHWSVFWTVIIGLLVQGLNTLWNIFTFIAVFLRFEPWQKHCDTGTYCSGPLTCILLVFVVLEHIWISAVISNVTLTVMAGGPYANWWYGTDSDTKSESLWALKKAAGTSLGSIAFGSLLVVFIEAIHFVMNAITGGGSSVERFKYGYIQSGRDVWRLFNKGHGLKKKGIAALLSDSLVGKSLHFACIANAILCAAFTYLYMTAIDRSMKIDGWEWLILLYSFFLAMSIGLVLTSAIEAGVSTIFVCLDKDPGKLKDRNPEFYIKFAPGGRYYDYGHDIYPEHQNDDVHANIVERSGKS
nr:uncharacterized protein CI109_006104 [Kwoniella shandongensis]KAA5525531.1 hypothetical protein CI109_006104 [Kwoniella shandongensis]